MNRFQSVDDPADKHVGAQSGSLVNLDPETDIVFRLARKPTAKVPIDFGAVGDWHRLLQLASDENALISLRDSLRTIRDTGMPVEVARQLAILSLDREFRMRRLQARLEQAIAALNQVGIEPLLLKGAALAYTVYGSFADRPMRDIDLLVGPDRAYEARTIMLESGWEPDPELPGDGGYGTHHHLPPLRDASAGGLRLEIHRALLPAGHPFHFTDDEIWSAGRRVKVGAGHAIVMHPSHHAVHLAIHFAWAHMLSQGAWHAFRDLATLVTTRALDWEDFSRTASRWGAASCSYWTLRLAHSLSALPVPPAVLQRLRPRLPEFIQRPLARHFVAGLGRSERGCPSARLDRALWSLAMQPERSDHGAVRPWLVSTDLLSALERRSRPAAVASHESSLLKLRRAGRYISEILV